MRTCAKVSRKVLFVLIEIGFLLPLAAQKESHYLALITDISGEVTVKRARRGEYEKALWGMQLSHGDRVKTLDSSEVSLLFSNNSLIGLGPNSTLTVSEGPNSPKNSNPIKNIDADVFVNIANLTLHRTHHGELGALAGLRKGSTGQIIEQLSPRKTKVKTQRPNFMWTAKENFEKFKVKLVSSEGIAWTRETSNFQLDYPDKEQPLAFGESYFWQIEGERLFDSVKSQSLGFVVLSQEEMQKVAAQEQAIQEMLANNNSSSYHFILGAFYEATGLWEEAIGEFQILAKTNTEAPLAHEILGRLYDNIGLKDKAIVELQKAVELSRE